MRKNSLRLAFIFVVFVNSAFAAQREPKAGPPEDEPAISNLEFITSLGVNTHVSQGYSPNLYISPLSFLGVRNIRDSGKNISGLLMLHKQAAVLIDLLASDVEGTIKDAHELAKEDALMAIEGPNEANNFPLNYEGVPGGGSGSWMPVAKFQRDLYSAVKSDSELNHYPVFHASEGGAETENVGLQFLTIPKGAQALLPDGTRFADYANVHNYVSGVHEAYLDNQAWQAADPTLSGRWDGLYAEYGRTWKRRYDGYAADKLASLPRVTTETGWSAASPAEERVQGIVLTNTYFAQFKRGWRHTFIYELGEGEGGGGNQGLFHKDWSPKLAAIYIHNMTSILSSGTLKKTTGSLKYSLPDAPDTAHSLLLQKNENTFDLVIWGERTEGVSQVSIRFGASHKKVSVFDITSAETSPITTFHDAIGIPITLSDHALIIEIEL